MIRFLAILLLVFVCSCGNKKDDSKSKSQDKNKEVTDKSKETTNKQGSESSSLDWYDVTGESPKIVELPSDLMEISGITFTDDDRLFGHGDEDGDVFEIDYNAGKIVKRFSLGDMLVVKGDFEDIAYAKDRFFLVESKGKLYEFKEGSDGSFVEYKTYKTLLNSSNDVEGLCYDPGTNSLMLACKGSGGEKYGKDKAVYSFSLNDMALNETPKFIISYKDIKNNSDEGKFNPSGIAMNPVSGTFYIIAARGNTIIELSKDGKVVNQKDLPASIHTQAEGIAFKNDGTLFISNEAKGKTPTLVIYPVKK